MLYKLMIQDETYDVDIHEVRDGVARVSVNGAPYEVNIENVEDLSPQGPPPTAIPRITRSAQAASPGTISRTLPKPGPAAIPGSGSVVAPIPGMIIKINVNVGDQVAAGQCVVVMEAMKMENDILAPINGTVSEIRVQKGADVSTGEVILVIA